jgi:hypothetical protein
MSECRQVFRSEHFDGAEGSCAYCEGCGYCQSFEPGDEEHDEVSEDSEPCLSFLENFPPGNELLRYEMMLVM